MDQQGELKNDSTIWYLQETHFKNNKNWEKKPKCSIINEWLNKLVCSYHDYAKKE